MYALSPYHSIIPTHTGLDRGGIHYNILQATHLETFNQQCADFTIITAEGDKVMISSSSQLQVNYVTYNSLARTKEEFTLFQGESFNIRINKALIVSVDGDLNAQELRDIKKALKAIDKMMRDFLSGDIGNSAVKALKIGKLESLLSLKASQKLEQNISLEQELVTEITSSLPEMADAIMSKQDIANFEHINNLTDRMIEVIKNSGIKPAKIISPIHKLFSHLSKGLFRNSPPGSPKLAMAKLIKSNLLNRIEQLPEVEERKGIEQGC